MILNFYSRETCDGPINMAIDDWLLTKAIQGQLSLRFYEWSVPTLSLGYFQKSSDRLQDPLLKDLAWVRRSTGGGAIVHHHELTYSLAIPANTPVPGDLPWPCRMHYIIADALKTLGVSSDPVVCGEEVKRDLFLCFQHHTAGDLAMGERSAIRHKVIGSAQRKQQGAILQHGSLLLARSEFAPSLPGIAELSGKNLPIEDVEKAIVKQLMAKTSWILHPISWSDEDRHSIQMIVDNKYGCEEWNLKR